MTPSPLRVARKASRIGIQELADLAGTSRQQIEKLERGERKLTKQWAERLAPHLGVTAKALLFPEDGTGAVTKGLKMVGVVEAGAFRSVDMLHGDGQHMPMEADPRYPAEQQACWLVRGDSMNERNIVDGMYVRGTMVDGMKAARSGDIVVVERSRYQGQEIELTVKEMGEDRENYILRPRSTNKNHKPIIIPKGGVESYDGMTIRVVAVVTAAFCLFT